MATHSTPSKTEATVTVTVYGERLGLYIVPESEVDMRGALIHRFDSINGEAGEVQRSGLVSEGFRLDRINDTSMTHAPFNDIVASLLQGDRPLRLTFRDLGQTEHRDSYGFLRSKVHAARAAAYAEASAERSRDNDIEWYAFLAELGGKSRGPSFGVQRLLRDSAGEVALCEDPTPRLNAVSPLHGRMEGLGPDTLPARRAAPAPAAEAAAVGEGGEGAAAAGAGPSPPPPPPAAAEPPPLQVIAIHKRSWRPSSIGVCTPPGLQTVLPGALPPPRQRAQLLARLEGLVLRGGVPAAFRPSVWWELSGAHAKAAMHPSYYYERLCTHAPPADVAGAIGKDIERTYPGHAFFDSAAGQRTLSRLLGAVALHNPDVGYCQSMNFLAGILLLMVGEERAFWVLDAMMNEILPPDYYTHTLLGVHVDQRVLAHLVSVTMPEVAEAYEKCGVELQVVTVGACGAPVRARRTPPPPPPLPPPLTRGA
jgi:hypothetical protein